MNTITKKLMSIAAFTALTFSVATVLKPASVHAQSVSLPDNNTSVTQGPVACGIELKNGNDCPVNGIQGEEKVMGIIKQVINVTSLLVGAICVIMIIFGGFRYMISGGDSSGVSTAKNTILYAVVGLVIVLMAQALVRFVFARTTAAG
jgi:hypothetical protein